MNRLRETTFMTTSQTQFFSEISAGPDGPVIPEAKRAYFQSRFRNRIFNFILGKFVEEQKNGLTKAKLARRIGKTPDVINRWLGAPTNLTTDTMSDLLLGISGEEFEAYSFDPNELPIPNHRPAEWLRLPNEATVTRNVVTRYSGPVSSTTSTLTKANLETVK
jgi:hypothetical protein